MHEVQKCCQNGGAESRNHHHKVIKAAMPLIDWRLGNKVLQGVNRDSFFGNTIARYSWLTQKMVINLSFSNFLGNWTQFNTFTEEHRIRCSIQWCINEDIIFRNKHTSSTNLYACESDEKEKPRVILQSLEIFQAGGSKSSEIFVWR